MEPQVFRLKTKVSAAGVTMAPIAPEPGRETATAGNLPPPPKPVSRSAGPGSVRGGRNIARSREGSAAIGLHREGAPPRHVEPSPNTISNSKGVDSTSSMRSCWVSQPQVRAAAVPEDLGEKINEPTGDSEPS